MRKILSYIILPIAIIALAYLIFTSIMQPVRFEKERSSRESVAIERMKAIRTLQTTFKSAHGHYAPVMDTLIDFYNNGKINVLLQIGSMDDSVAVAHTEKIKKSNKGISNEKLYEMYLAGDKNLIITLPVPVNVKDTLFNSNPSFKAEDLRYIPFSGGDTVIMKTIVKQVSGVDVPLFEAQIPFTSLLKNMDQQLIVNLVAERKDTDRYPGLMVGSIDNPNNNAGNWE